MPAGNETLALTHGDAACSRRPTGGTPGGVGAAGAGDGAAGDGDGEGGEGGGDWYGDEKVIVPPELARAACSTTAPALGGTLNVMMVKLVSV